MRKWLILLVLLVFCSSVADEVEDREVRITAEFKGVTLREAVEEVARLGGKRLYCAGLEEGSFSGSFVDTPVEVVMARILVTTPEATWRLDSSAFESNLLIVWDGHRELALVSCVEKEQGDASCEFLLWNGYPTKELNFLEGEYPQLSLTSIPLRSGAALLRVVGGPDEILEFRRDLADGSRISDPRFLLPVRVASPEKVKERLAKLVPDVQFEVFGDTLLRADGPLKSIEQARSLLWDLDVPTNR